MKKEIETVSSREDGKGSCSRRCGRRTDQLCTRARNRPHARASPGLQPRVQPSLSRAATAGLPCNFWFGPATAPWLELNLTIQHQSYSLIVMVNFDICRCFFPRGSHQRVNLYACSPFRMVMQEDTEIYPGSGKRRPYVQRGGESSYYLAPKCLYRGEYKRGMKGVALLRVCGFLRCDLSLFYSWVPPFIAPRRDTGYMHRC